MNLGQIVMKHKNAMWINNYSSEVEYREVNQDLPSMKSELLAYHMLFSPPFLGPGSGTQRNYDSCERYGECIQREGEKRKFFQEFRILQLKWIELCIFSFSICHLTPKARDALNYSC